MSLAAILGAGPIGAAIAHRLAERARFRDVLLIDEQQPVAAGKALDIRQSGPIAGADVNLTATNDVLAAAGAAVIIVADASKEGEWRGESGLAMVQRLARAGTTAPLVFAGPGQIELIEKVYREARVERARLVGTASSAQATAARALIGVELGLSGADVQVAVAGRPPDFVIGWSSATAGGALISDRVAPHRMLAVASALAKLWPAGPQSIGAATAVVAEALVFGSRRLHQAMTIIDGDGDLEARGVAAMLPLELGNGRVKRYVMPSLSNQERTRLLTQMQ